MIAADNRRISEELDRERTLRIYLLGRFEVEQGSRLLESEGWRSGKARSLFKILLARRNYQISRQECQELLWPELDQERAANNLNQAVYSLRRTLEPDLERAGASAYLRTEGSKLQLNLTLIHWIDVEEFKRLYRQAALGADLRLYEQAASLYTGDYLPEDLYEDWSISRRESLRQEWIEVLLQMAALYRQAGQEEKYQQSLHRVLEADFANEESAQKLMLALAESGRRDESVALYRSFAGRLQNRLNVQPLDETRQLYHEIVAGRSGATRPALTLVTAPAAADLTPARLSRPEQPSGTLPLPSSSLRLVTGAKNPLRPVKDVIGRQAQERDWQKCLREALSGQGGLMTLLGEAGSGKTHLAQVFALQAEQAGFEVLRLSLYPEGAELPFGPILTMVEERLNGLDEVELKECLKLCHPALARLVPALAEPLAAGPNRSEPSNEEIFAATTSLLVWLSRKRRLALVIDDLSWLSGPALRLLRYWLSHSSLRSLLVLATLRPGSPNGRNDLENLTAWAGESGGPVCRLNRFDKADLRQLLTIGLDGTPGPLLLETIARASQGNPRLALELAQAWQGNGKTRLVNGGWELTESWNDGLPGPVTAYLRRITGSLSTSAQVLLGLAALSGESVSFEVLRQIVLHRQDGAGWWIELAPARLGQALTEATESGLLLEEGSGYRFDYPLLAQSLLAGMSQGQRRCWQEVIAWAKTQVAQNGYE